MFRFLAATALIAAISFAMIFADEVATLALKVSGDVEKPLEPNLADLKSLPHVQVMVQDNDTTHAAYEGASLWDIINRAKPRLGNKSHAGIARGYVVIHAADNYQATFSLAEINGDFAENKVILAYARDGKPLTPQQGPFQVIAPGDKIRARWVRQVISLEVVVPSAAPTK